MTTAHSHACHLTRWSLVSWSFTEYHLQRCKLLFVFFIKDVFYYCAYLVQYHFILRKGSSNELGLWIDIVFQHLAERVHNVLTSDKLHR